MCKVYGYARISTSTQSIKRQIENITEHAPDAEIYQEVFTGTKIDRPEFQKLLKRVKSGDTIIFDEISRMSRDAAEGFSLYKELMQRGVRLVFLKERTLDTDCFTSVQQVAMTNTDIDCVLRGINEYLFLLAERQIQAAFAAAQHEVDFLHKRTVDGMRAAHAGEKISATKTGMTYTTEKSKTMKDKIRKMSKDFDGSMTDAEVMETLHIARNTYYKYKREMKAAIEG